MNKELTGAQFFLRCAWPCASDRLHANKINQADFDQLKSLIESGEEPDKSFLGRCFPTAVDEMRQCCQKFNKGDPWLIKNVKWFWQTHHTHKKGDCAFQLFAVTKVVGREIFVGSGFPAQNIYGLPNIDQGDLVWVHRRAVVEKDGHVNATPKG